MPGVSKNSSPLGMIGMHPLFDDTAYTIRGVKAVSRLANYFPERFIAFVFLAVPYVTIIPPTDTRMLLEPPKKAYSYGLYGYWLFFSEDDANDVVQLHVSSNLSNDMALDAQTVGRWTLLLAYPSRTIHLSGRPISHQQEPRGEACSRAWSILRHCHHISRRMTNRHLSIPSVVEASKRHSAGTRS